MKKSTIVMLCVGFALLVLGGGIFFLTFSMGAVGYEGNFLQLGFGPNRNSEPLYYDDNSYDSQETYTYGGRVYENKALDLEGENAQFTQVELQLGVADAVITQDGGPGYVNAENFPEGKISFQVADGKLVVQDLTQKVNLNFSLRQSKQLRARKLTVNLPPEVKLSAVSLNRGAGDLSVTNVSADTITIADRVGNLYMENVSVNSMNLSGGVGDCTLVNFTSTGDVVITRGVGEMELSQADIGGNLTVSDGTGDFDLNGAVKGDISIDAGVGDCDLELFGSRDDYYFTLEKGVGDLTVDDIDVSSKQKSFGLEGAPYNVSLKGGTGDISVEFLQ